jgi:cyclase
MNKISKTIAIICLILGLLIIPNLVHSQTETDYSKVEIQTIPVQEGIYMLTGEGGNIGVSVGNDGILMIDSQFAPLTDKIKTALKKINKQPIRFLVNTHWHFDHVGGNENLGASGVTIIAHENVRKRLNSEQFIAAFNRKVAPLKEEGIPKITFEDEIDFHLNNNHIHIFHVDPAHTDGDSVIHFQEQNVIHTGDLYFNGMYPFIDTSSGGSIKGMIEASEEILAICNSETKIIPGHGNLSNCDEFKTYQTMLKTVKNTVENGIKKGISKEDFIKSKPTEELDKTWGKGFLKPEQFLDIVYTDLSKS